MISIFRVFAGFLDLGVFVFGLCWLGFFLVVLSVSLRGCASCVTVGLIVYTCYLFIW